MTPDRSNQASPIRILFIDDSEDDVLLLTLELQQRGLDFVCQHVDTLPALDHALRNQHWDVVITDHHLVGFSSADVLAQVRAFNPELPVIIVSGAICENRAVDAMQQGAQDFVMKDNLARLLPVILREHKQRATRLDLQQQTADMRLQRQQERAREKQKMSELLAAVKELSLCDSAVDGARIAFTHFLAMYPYLAVCTARLLLPQKNGESLVSHLIWDGGHFAEHAIPVVVDAPFLQQLRLLADIALHDQRLVMPIRSERRAWGYLVLDHFPPVEGEENLDTDFASNLIHFLAMIMESIEAKENSRLSTVGAMAAGIVHDLKNPISAIQGCAELALDPAMPARDRDELMRAIISETGRMAFMAQEILEFSRNEIILNPVRMPARQFMADIARTLHQMCNSAGVLFRQECQTDAMLELDVERVRRVLLNIARNACDALQKTGGATPCFELILRQHDQQVEFIARDNGPGIPAPIRATLFEPFVTYGKVNGTGLGMAIAKRIVDAHGGDIRFDSSPHTGTEFRIRLPRALAEQARHTRPGHLFAAGANLQTAHAAGASLEHVSVLVAEDNPVNQKIICTILEQQGCHVCRAANGLDALDLLERDRFDVVLMDFEMPGMGGLEVTTRLRQRPEFKQLVIIGLTGHSELDELQSARSAGMNGVLCKPLNQAMLNATILSLLRHARPV